ncbi:MAG: RIP metalloprotease RseP [Gemmatimonadetes bacterium]|nr:RIP metalloprotease RseP [Gemmatimonadota bacterium]MBT6148506.1 RIP metalloprotease RseP [Gemmatimonadota bacterium]
MLDFLSTLVSFIIALGILVFVHELGHFLVAKRAGIRVERFSLGYPPKMIGFTYGETEYCISWVPFGGYVKVAGMADVGSEDSTGAPWEFPSKSVGTRIGVIAAGPLMNFLFAFCAFVLLYNAYGIDTIDSTSVNPEAGSIAEQRGLQNGDQIRSVNGTLVSNAFELSQALDLSEGSGVTLEIERHRELVSIDLPAADDEGDYGLRLLLPTTVGNVIDGMPAAELGLEPGDLITVVAGNDVSTWTQMREAISVHPDEAITIIWQRDGQDLEGSITPRGIGEGEDRFGQIGISPHSSTTQVGFVDATSMALTNVVASSGLILEFLGRIYQPENYNQVGGPISIAMMAGDTAERGTRDYINFLAQLSVNLAILNLLPIPVLDGGHLLFLAMEAIRGRPPSLRLREISQQVGLVVLLFIMVLVTFNDLNRHVVDHVVELFQ